MANIISFGAMCRYSDVSRVKWRNILIQVLLKPLSKGEKNAQLHQGSKVTVAASKNDICPLKLLYKLIQSYYANSIEVFFILCRFNVCLVRYQAPG
jgi:hypothetical protein